MLKRLSYTLNCFAAYLTKLTTSVPDLPDSLTSLGNCLP